MDETEARRPFSQRRHYWEGLLEFDSVKCVSWRDRRLSSTFRWCHQIQTAHLHTETLLWLKTILRQSVLWLLQQQLLCAFASRMHLRDGGSFLFGKWNKTLHKTMWHDRQIICCNHAADASYMCEWSYQIRSTHWSTIVVFVSKSGRPWHTLLPVERDGVPGKGKGS